MEVRPIASAMWRNKTRAILIALQIALALAIVSNALFIIDERIEKVSRETGIDVGNLIYVWSWDLREESDYFAGVDVDLARLEALPGVANVTYIGSPPLSGGGNGECFSVEDDVKAPSVCHNRNKIDENGLDTLGLELVAGRDFTRDDVVREKRNQRGFPDIAIVTQALADELFPDGDALGKTIYQPSSDGDSAAVTIVGIVERMQGPWLSLPSVERVMLQPVIREGDIARYSLRAAPGERDRVMAEIDPLLRQINPHRLMEVHSQEDILARSYQSDRAMTKLLSTVVLLLIAVTALGVVGLANSSVNQRTKQIGTRRALGARKLDVARYFMVENVLVTTAGGVVGSVLAVAFNYWLVNEYAVPRIDPLYIAIGVGLLYVLGQLAVLAPARRAAAVHPSVATRTV